MAILRRKETTKRVLLSTMLIGLIFGAASTLHIGISFEQMAPGSGSMEVSDQHTII